MSMYVYPVSDGKEVLIEIMGADGRHSPLATLEMARRLLNSALANLPPQSKTLVETDRDILLERVCKAVAHDLESLGRVTFATMELLIAANAPREEDTKLEGDSE